MRFALAGGKMRLGKYAKLLSPYLSFRGSGPRLIHRSLFTFGKRKRHNRPPSGKSKFKWKKRQPFDARVRGSRTTSHQRHLKIKHTRYVTRELFHQRGGRDSSVVHFCWVEGTLREESPLRFQYICIGSV